MLCYFLRLLEQYGISGAYVWGYISFRALLTLIFSLIISTWSDKRFVKYLYKKQITKAQRNTPTDPFGVNKIGVSSMGGAIIIAAIVTPTLLSGRLRNIYLTLMVVITLWLGLLGGMDDYIKIFRRNKKGLRGKYRIVGQVDIGLIVGLVLWSSPDVKINESLAIEQ